MRLIFPDDRHRYTSIVSIVFFCNVGLSGCVYYFEVDSFVDCCTVSVGVNFNFRIIERF